MSAGRRAGTDAFGNPVAPGGVAPSTPAPFAGPQDSGWVYASWGRRAVGAIIDGIVIALIVSVLFIPLGAVGVNVETEGDLIALALAFLAYLAVVGLAALLYQPLMLWRTDGRTLGKLAAGTRVVKANRTSMDLGTAVLREVVLKSLAVGFVASWTFGIAYLVDWLWPLFDDEKRALHDFVVETRVVDA